MPPLHTCLNRKRVFVRSGKAGSLSAVVTIGLCMTMCSLDAMALQFGAGFNADWTFSSSKHQCVLTQEIPGYGTARFFGSPGLGLRFELASRRDLFGSGEVVAIAQSPEWHPAWPDLQERGYLHHIDGGLISAEDPIATALLMDLRQGRVIKLAHPARYGNEEDVIAATISPLRFGPGYAALMSCHQWSMPANYADVSESTIRFGSGQRSLTAADRARLDLVARYVLADRSMTGILIDGHTDKVGHENSNLELSEQRARLVADHMAHQGIPRGMMTVRFHGSLYPVDSTATAAANDLNRRVAVQLERHGSATLASASLLPAR
jgi:sodium-type flagellar protein MotY